MSLAIFDLDNTLLGGDSDHAWGEFLLKHGIVDGDFHRKKNDYFFEQYQQGTLDIDEFLDFALQPLAQHSKRQLDQWHQQFMQEFIRPIRLPKADALLKTHRDNGDYLLIITATNQFITEPIASCLGVDHILATVPEFIDGAYTGKALGTPCFQHGKVTRLKEWLKQTTHSLDDSYFYSDSHNDLPLMELVTHPVAVDPDESLRQHAQNNNWPIISLR